jgi:hypothetical protein
MPPSSARKPNFFSQPAQHRPLFGGDDAGLRVFGPIQNGVVTEAQVLDIPAQSQFRRFLEVRRRRIADVEIHPIPAAATPARKNRHRCFLFAHPDILHQSVAKPFTLNKHRA